MAPIAQLIRYGLLTVVLAGLSGHAQTVPSMINYQGRVTVGGTAVDTTAYFKFALVDWYGTTSTTSYWSNDGSSIAGSEPTGAVALPVSKGLYAVLLGNTDLGMVSIPTSAFSDHAAVGLRVWFSQASGGPYQRLTPDQRIVSVGYAMLAETVPDGTITAAKLAPGLASPLATPDALVQRDGSGDFAAGTIAR